MLPIRFPQQGQVFKPNSPGTAENPTGWGVDALQRAAAAPSIGEFVPALGREVNRANWENATPVEQNQAVAHNSDHPNETPWQQYGRVLDFRNVGRIAPSPQAIQGLQSAGAPTSGLGLDAQIEDDERSIQSGNALRAKNAKPALGQRDTTALGGLQKAY